MTARTASLLSAILLLAACGEEPAATDDDAREATGEVLEGTISDAMLPIEEVRSQPPLADEEAGGGAGQAGAGGAQPSASVAEAAAGNSGDGAGDAAEEGAGEAPSE